MKSNIETRSIDSYIGTGYHLLQILQESLYQIERYTPELEKEKGEIGHILELARSTGYKFSLEERAELERLKALDGISVKLAAEAEELALRIMERCETLFAGHRRRDPQFRDQPERQRDPHPESSPAPGPGRAGVRRGRVGVHLLGAVQGARFHRQVGPGARRQLRAREMR